MNRYRRTCSVVAALALLFGACDSGTVEEPTEQRSPVGSPTLGSGRVVGLVGTMSGPGSWRGTDAFEGADLGVARLNRDVLDGELPFELVTLDDQGDPERATELIEELAASDRTVGVIYAGVPGALPPADDALAAAGIPGIAVFADLYSARLLRSHLFQVSPPFLWQARRIVSYLGRDRDYDHIGALADRSLDGDTAIDSLKLAVQDTNDLRLTARRYREPGDIEEALDALEKARVEAIVFHGPQLLDELVDALAERDSLYRGTRSARWASLAPGNRGNRSRRAWRPQIVGFDGVLGQVEGRRPPAGTVAADTYARGVDYLPIPSFEQFRSAFDNWWAMPPLGTELRAYESVRMIGWAARRTDPGGDVARSLEAMRDKRFGGLDITLGPDDHVAPGQTTIGLWVVPRSNEDMPGNRVRAEDLPWVPLARGFSTDGSRTDVLPQDWRYLFRNPPPPEAPAPRVTTMKFGIATRKRDPLH